MMGLFMLLKTPMPLDCLTEKTLRSLAGDRWFARGRSYKEENRVTNLSLAGDSLSARVVGTQPYRVRLTCNRSRLDYSCSCPVGEDGNFCKHCVAVGLSWLDQDALSDATGYESNLVWRRVLPGIGLRLN